MVERTERANSQAVPRHLYKFRSLRDDLKKFAKDLIVKQHLYFSKPTQLNDPFEFRPALELALSRSEMHEYAQRQIQRHYPDKNRDERRRLEAEVVAKAEANRSSFKEGLAQVFWDTVDQSGVFSLSPHFLDVLMWPHYADDHTGICVRFDTIAMIMIPDLVPLKVSYFEERPLCHPILDDRIDMLKKAALTKGLPWAYEEEWRVLRHHGGGQVVPVEAPIVSGVILGARITPENRDEVLTWVSECKRPMEVLQSRLHERTYTLEVEPGAV
jgi:hypothetical protein